MDFTEEQQQEINDFNAENLKKATDIWIFNHAKKWTRVADDLNSPEREYIESLAEKCVQELTIRGIFC